MEEQRLEKKVRNLIVVSQNTRLGILGALFSRKVCDERPLIFEELKSVLEKSSEDRIKKHITVLEKSNLVDIKKIDVPEESQHEVYDITEDGIEILDDLGIDESFVKSIDI